MARNWLRRALLAAFCTSVVGLAGCGSSTIESALTPDRFIAFGDGFSDLGQSGKRYTVNDNSINNWSELVATSFAKPLGPSASGGLSYARGNARVSAKPDAAGNAATLTITEQIDAFLAVNTFGKNDVVLVNGGISDIVAQMATLTAGSQTSAQMLAKVSQAGKDLGTQIRRMVNSGAKYVVVAGTFNLAKTPWSTAISQGDLLLQASSRFNEELLVSIVDLGANVLYVDAACHFNLVTASPTTYGFTDSSTVVCNSVDAGAGIGTGTGQVNSALCTASTIVTNLDYSTYVFADRVYPTPVAQRLFGDYASARLRARW